MLESVDDDIGMLRIGFNQKENETNCPFAKVKAQFKNGKKKYIQQGSAEKYFHASNPKQLRSTLHTKTHFKAL